MVYDLFQAQRNEGQRFCKSFVLWPDKWKAFRCTRRLIWNSLPAKKSRVKDLPNQTGVYAFVVCPGIAEFPTSGIIAYIGETKGVTQTLRKRCAVYFRKSEYSIRPHIGEMMELWSSHLKLYFAEVPASEVPALEDALLLAFVPPFNRKFPGEFNKVAASIYHS